MPSKKHLLAVMILLLTLFSTIATAQYYLDYSDSETANSYYTAGEEVTIPQWYEVSEEEILFCQQYAGTTTPESIYTTDASAQAFQPVSKLTLSLQGYYTTQYENTLYEIAWYVHPLSEDLTYTIVVTKEDGTTEEFTTLFATVVDGSAGYEAFESTEQYTEISIILEDGSNALTVPFIEK